MRAWLKRRWATACAETIGTEAFWSIAVDHRSIHRALEPLIQRYARGRTLDAGAGRLAWRDLLRRRASTYLAADFVAAHPTLDFCCDLEGRIPLPDGSVDTIFCCSVLEHSRDPGQVLQEFRRVLAPGGCVILSVPFLYYLHDPPRDFFRFTRYGVVELARSADLDVVECTTSGGLFHTIFQAGSMIATACLWSKRAPWAAAAATTLLTGVASVFDRIDRDGLFAQSVNAVLRRPV